MARGVTARRSRNEGRRRGLMALRKERAEALRAIGRAKLELGEAVQGGQVVIEADKITKTFTRPDGTTRPIVNSFSTRIQRGDRIGVIGPNGAGKTTLIKILTGDLAADGGKLQARHQCDAALPRPAARKLRSRQDPVANPGVGGGDSIIAQGRSRHVVAYLRDFLFDEKQATMPVRALSGGERARLLLAKLFAQPANLIILDEPTNDLDMDTLDLLQEVLGDFDGTVIVVSTEGDASSLHRCVLPSSSSSPLLAVGISSAQDKIGLMNGQEFTAKVVAQSTLEIRYLVPKGKRTVETLGAH